jgi:arsenate reductase-like glutaredoxin family protein
MSDTIKDTLINKTTLLSWVSQVQNGLENPIEKNDKYWRNVNGLKKIVNESDCCIDQCSDLQRLYRWLLCTFRRSLEWLDTDTHHSVKEIWIDRLNKAWLAMEDIVVEELKGKDMRYVLSDLGFNECFNERNEKL